MDKFNEKLYHLLSEYHPEHKEKTLTHPTKHTYTSMVMFYLGGMTLMGDWDSAITNILVKNGIEKEFAVALASIRDDWELADLEEE